jgi:predicted AlkP superfamily phosphohydrolase/phosphomutase
LKPAGRLFILGLDGSPLPLLTSLMRSGDLPNLARLFEQGSAIEMTSSLPDVSAVAWTSINTGKNPGKHGIYGFVDRKPNAKAIEVMTAAHTRSRTIWEIASDAGKRAIAINVPLSYPPQRINGIVVSDFLAPSLEKAVYPTTILPHLQGIGYRIDTDPRVARESLDAFLQDFRITAEKRAEAVLSLMERESWDLFMVVFMETDRLHHFLWQYHDEGDSNYGPKFVDAYRQVDELAGRIIGKLSPDDGLIVLSDHGFTTLHREVYLNVWLQEHGYLRLLPGVDLAEATMNPLAAMDPSTTAYSLDPGRIYVNLRGREPDGSVLPEDAPGVIESLAASLPGLADPESGVPMLRWIYRADQIYEGPHRDRAPDLLVMGHDGYDVKGTLESSALTGKGKLVGMHKYDNATLFVRDRKISGASASVRDVLPTACTLMGIDAPSDLDGKALVQA